MYTTNHTTIIGTDAGSHDAGAAFGSNGVGLPVNVCEIFLVYSNIGFLVVAALLFAQRRLLGTLLFICMFLSSSYYHLCMAPYHVTWSADMFHLYPLCATRNHVRANVFLVFLDYVFANTTFVYMMLYLVPRVNRNSSKMGFEHHNYHRFERPRWFGDTEYEDMLTIIIMFVVIIIYGVMGSFPDWEWVTEPLTIEEDLASVGSGDDGSILERYHGSTLLTNIVTVIYILCIYVVHMALYLEDRYIVVGQELIGTAVTRRGDMYRRYRTVYRQIKGSKINRMTVALCRHYAGFYYSRFHVKWLLTSLSLLAVSIGIFVSAAFVSDWFYQFTHGFWHVAVAIAAIICIVAQRDRNVSSMVKRK